MTSSDTPSRPARMRVSRSEAVETVEWLRDVIAHPEKYNDPSLPFRISVSTFGRARPDKDSKEEGSR